MPISDRSISLTGPPQLLMDSSIGLRFGFPFRARTVIRACRAIRPLLARSTGLPLAYRRRMWLIGIAEDFKYSILVQPQDETRL
jgi:hypothetical protein